MGANHVREDGARRRADGAALVPLRWRAWGALLVLALAAHGLRLGPGPAVRGAADGARPGDAALYRGIERRVAAGQRYYPAAVAEQRARGYPLRPFVTVRPPTLAVAMAAAGGPGAALWALRLLALAAAGGVVARLRAEGVRGRRLLAAAALALAGCLPFAQPQLVWWHELWAGLLAMLALALRRPGRFGASLAVTLAAVAVRELALPLPVAMMLAAAVERRRAEAWAWAGAVAAALALVAAHAWAVMAATAPADPASPGWAAASGWRFALAAARHGTVLVLVPWPAAALLVPLAWWGWAGRAGGLARRAALLLAAWLGLFLAVGRPDNLYWGLLPGPLLLPGLALAAPSPGRLRNAIFTPAKILLRFGDAPVHSPSQAKGRRGPPEPGAAGGHA